MVLILEEYYLCSRRPGVAIGSPETTLGTSHVAGYDDDMDQLTKSFEHEPLDEPMTPRLAELVAGAARRGDRLLGIGDVSRECGVTLRALRFYEGKGLLSPIRDGGVRLYDEEALRRLAIVVRAKRVGLSLGEIRELLDFVTATGSRPRRLSGTLERLRRQVDMLEDQRREAERSLAALRAEIAALEAGLSG